MDKNIMSVNFAETQNIEVYWQDEAVLNLDVALMYIKSGQKEIKDYADKKIFPQLYELNKQAQTAKELATSSAQAAATSELNAKQSADKTMFNAQTAETAATTAVKNADTATAAADVAEKSAISALQSAQNAAASAESAAERAEILNDERFLHKLGDEVKSGTLTVDGFEVQNSDNDSAIVQKNNQFSFADQLTMAHSRSYAMSDKNNQISGQIKNVIDTDKASHLLLRASNYTADGKANQAELGVHISADGKAGVTIPTPSGTLPSEAINLQYADANYANLSKVNVFCANVMNNRNIYKTNKYSVGEIPEKNLFTGFSSYDKNNAEYASIYSRINTEGGIQSSLYVCNANNKSNEIRIAIDKNNNVVTYAPACGAVNSLVTTTLKSTGCCKLGNGLLIQWGTNGVANGSKIVFKQPFANVSYVVFTQVTAVADNLAGAVSVFCDTTLKTTTSFSVAVSQSVALDWIAIGYA